MAKTCTPFAEFPHYQPCVIAGHISYPDAPGINEYHVLGTFCTLWYNPWDLILLAPWDGITEFDPATQNDDQLNLIKALIAYPEVISAACSYCRWTGSHPWHAIWNIAEGHQGEKVIPACPWNGSLDYPYTPDQWPPANAC